MAFSAHTDPDVLRETCSEYDVIDKQAAELAHLIHDSKHFIVFTGAGISTSAGIPDFRGPNGIWTREAQGVPPTADDDWDLEKCSPTKTHMALVKLETEGLLCYIVSQNCDGLHYRSGIPSDKLSELHGNMYLEYCKSCEKQYLRDYDCQSDEDDHKTGRKCTCRNPLYDSLIHFGEDLPEKTIGKAFQMAEQCDLCLVLGSSLTVTPAADIPKLAGERSKLVICNLQKTPLDAKASLRIFGKSDLFMERVMRHLNLPVPVWKLERRIEINATVAKPSSKGMQKFTIEVVGLAPHEGPASFLSQCEFQVVKASAAKCKSQGRKIKREPFVFSTFTKQTKEKDSTHNIQIIFGFMGHFNEPKYTFNFTMENNSSTYTKTIELDLDPQTGQWNYRAANPERGNRNNRAEFVLSGVGYAIGLGNLWRFPYKVYENGGGSFLLAYLLMPVLIAFPGLLLDLAVGQFTSNGPVKVPKYNAPMHTGVGYLMIIKAIMGACLYTPIMAAYALFYLFSSFQAVMPWHTCKLEQLMPTPVPVVDHYTGSNTGYFQYRGS